MAIVESFLPLAALGVSTDCNGNNTPDECDIADGTVEDCNGNGVPDACDNDCNGNNMPDECEIAAGLAEDCNANGRPDECDLNSGPFFADSGPLTPLGLGNPQTFFLMQPPQAAGTVRLIFSARADLVSSSAFVTVDLNGIGIGNIFVSAASCPEQPNIASLSVDPAVYNDSFGAGSLEIMMTPSPAVDQFCEDTTFIQVTVEYESTGLDTDGDGIVDACESCPADLDLDLQVSINDMLLLLAQWGPCPPLCLGDIDSDGEIGISDLLLLLAQWGPCP
jgi:hypothetical protein